MKKNLSEQRAELSRCSQELRKQSFLKGLLFICMPVLLFSCGDSEFTPEFDRETFEYHRQLWLDQDIQNYSFMQRYALRLSARQSTTLFVRDGIVRYFQFYGTGSLLDPFLFGYGHGEDSFFSSPLLLSISEMYAEIERYANFGKYKIEVRYDSEWHYPAYVWIQKSICFEDRAIIESIHNFTLDPEIPEE